MKNLRKNTIVLLFLTLTANVSFAQTNSILGRFIGQENNGSVYLNWQIVAGSTCNGIKIHRSADSVSFTEIGRIDGICGDISAPETYNFVDHNPYPSQNFYRLELGYGSFSEIISITIIDIDDSPYQVRPNPVIHTGRIYFNNESHDEFRLVMHNLNGHKILELKTREEFFEVNAQFFAAGLYLFTIFNPSEEPFESGKLMIR